jgi:hypothetical protein
MTRSNGPKYAPGYDLFKLIVAVILTIILITLLLLDRQQPPALPIVTPAPQTATETVITPPTITETLRPATHTIQPPSATMQPTPTMTAVLSPTSTPTASPLATLLPTPTEVIPSDTSACPSASSRIRVGDTLQVLTRLNLRSGPGLDRAIIRTNNPGTTMLVIGGPVCTRLSVRAGSRAYLWWQVRIQNGQEGWSAEASLITPNYFLAPIR